MHLLLLQDDDLYLIVMLEQSLKVNVRGPPGENIYLEKVLGCFSLL